MSAITTYNSIKAMLEEYGLRELPGLVDIDEVKESHKEDGYVLKPIGTDETEFANNSLFTLYQWSLEIIFKNIDSAERVNNFDTFNTIKKALQELDEFKGFLSTEFTRLGNFTFLSLGTITFEMGAQGCA